MSAAEFREQTKPFLRPDQAAEMSDEKRRLESILAAPPHISQGVDRAEIGRQLRKMGKQVEDQTPRPYQALEKDAAVGREEVLREQFTQGMPTAAEMRRSPAGAVDKHMSWEKRNKDAILEWKNIRRRMFVGGDLPETVGAIDHANIEMFRPVGGSHELTMHGEQIPGKIIHLPPDGAGLPAVMSDEQSAVLQDLDPDLHDKMLVLNNDQRAIVLAAVDKMIAAAHEPEELVVASPMSDDPPKRKVGRPAKKGVM